MNRHEHQLALPRVLIGVSQQAILDVLRRRGADIPEWDAEQLLDLPERITRSAFSPLVSFDEGYHEFSSPVLGAAAFELNYLQPPSDLVRSGDTASRRTRYTATIAWLDVPARVLNIELDAPKPNRAAIITQPDMPPVAVHSEHLAAHFHFDKAGAHSDSDLVDPIMREYGDDAVNILDDDNCAAIIGAVQHGHPRVEPDMYPY